MSTNVTPQARKAIDDAIANAASRLSALKLALAAFNDAVATIDKLAPMPGTVTPASGGGSIDVRRMPAVNVQANKPAFFCLRDWLTTTFPVTPGTEPGNIPPLVRWTIEDPRGDGSWGQYTQMFGFNIAYLWDQPGSYTVTAATTMEDGSAGPTFVFPVIVAVDTRAHVTMLQAGTDLAILDGVTASNTRYQLLNGASYTLSKPTRLNVDLVLADMNGAQARIDYTGPRTTMLNGKPYPNTLIAIGKGVVTGGYRIYTPYTCPPDSDPSFDAADQHDHSLLVFFVPPGPATNVGVFRVFATGVGQMANFNTNPERVLWVATETDDDLRTYHLWIQGKEIVIVGVKVTDSKYEHGIRCGGDTSVIPSGPTEFVSITYCDVQNKDKRNATPPEAYNFDKSSITTQAGSWYYRAHNVCRAAAGMGPLGVSTTADPVAMAALMNAVTRYVVSDGEKFTSPYGINMMYGLINARIERLVAASVSMQAPFTYNGRVKAIDTVSFNNCQTTFYGGAAAIAQVTRFSQSGTVPPPATIV